MKFYIEMYSSFIIIFISILKFCLSVPFKNPITLERLSTLYLPNKYDNGTAHYGFDEGAVEQMAYDHIGNIVYLVGENVIHAVNITDAWSPVILYHHEYRDVDITDIEFCGSYLFVAFDNKTNRENGYVHVYLKYNSTSNLMKEVHSVRVGDLPDMILPTSDCRTVVVAVEAEGYSDGTTFTDPEGGIGLLKFTTDDISGPYTYKKLDFRKYNDGWEELVKKGARFVYRENGNTFAQDVEPEYIAFNDDETVAYIALQENNAVAEVNLAKEEITHIHPLGFKDWTQHRFDASDRDNKINIQSWPVYGMYQPDSIHVINVKNKQYLLTANEGDAKDYEDLAGAQGWNEETRLRNIWSQVDTNSTIYKWSRIQGLNDTIVDDENLGRLTVSKVDGKAENQSTYSTIYTYGGRGFAIFSLDNMELVYDSGSDIETQIAELKKSIFNSDPEGPEEFMSTWDKRSDNKGPETESLAVAQFDDGVVLFVGNERPGIISIYSIKDNVREVRFESLWSGIMETNGTWNQLYTKRTVADIDPEDMRFVAASKSPIYQPLLLVAGSASGTLSIFKVNGIDSVNAIDPPGPASVAAALVSSNGFSLSTLIITCLYIHLHL